MPSLHMMELPRKVVVGNDILRIVGDVSLETGLTGKAAVITGENTGKIAGEKVLTSLQTSKFECEYLEIKKNASIPDIETKLQKTGSQYCSPLEGEELSI